MAGSIVNTYGSTNTSLTNMQIVMDGTRRGHDSISLTNMSTTSVPAIAAGGQIEIAGSLYQFSTEEAISTTGVTSTADATWYVRLTASSSEVSAAFSTVAPTWREDYSGWYFSTASADRYLKYDMYVSSGTYGAKGLKYCNQIRESVSAVAVLTGNTSTTAAGTYIPYPDGFVRGNSIVDRLAVYNTAGFSYLSYGYQDLGMAGPLTAQLLSTAIYIYHSTVAGFMGQAYILHVARWSSS